jgi:hypothetical protein
MRMNLWLGLGREAAAEPQLPYSANQGAAVAAPPEGRINPLLAGGLGLAAGYYLVNRYENRPQPYYYEAPFGSSSITSSLPAESITTTITDYPGYQFQQPAAYTQYSPAYGKISILGVDVIKHLKGLNALIKKLRLTYIRIYIYIHLYEYTCKFHPADSVLFLQRCFL